MRDTDEPAVSRRQFVALSGAGLATVVAASSVTVEAQAAFSSNPFQLGSASGDATTNSVILWTRLALDPLAADAGMGGQPTSITVSWGVYPSYNAAAASTSPVRSGSVAALQSQHWSVHVEAGTAGTGSALTHGTRYWYRFSVAGTATTYYTWIGTFRTAPAATADVDARFAVVSCQNYVDRYDGRSYWHAYDHLNDEMDIADPDANPALMDFLVHLGDYIYEGGFSTGDVDHGIPTVPAGVCTTLSAYRQRWGWYLSRDSLQRTRRQYPSFVVLDDHELVNDLNGARVINNFGDGTPEQDVLLRRYNDALTAYWENQPLRGGRPTAPSGQDKLRLTITRTIRWGKHLSLMLWDCRQQRTRYNDPGPSILGSAQLNATLSLIQSSTATWTAFGTTSPFTSYVTTVQPGSYTSGWMAFPVEREAITGALKTRRAGGGFDAVFLAGDVHCALASTVRRTTDPRASSEVVAVEFTGPPMSSDGGSFWPDRRASNSEALLRWIGYQPVAPEYPPYKGYLRCAATAATFYSNYVCGSGWLDPAGTVTSRFRSKTTAGTVDVVPY